MSSSAPKPHREPQAGDIPSVATIIVNWNGLSDTIDCVNATLSLDYPRQGVFVVDNGSRPSQAAAIRERFSQVHVIESSENLGFAGGCNLAIEVALEHNYDYIFLLNNDAYPSDSGLLRQLLCVMQRHGAAVVGPKVTFESPPSIVWFAGGRVYRRTGRTKHIGFNKPADRFTGVVETDYITGCALLAHASVFREVGLLDESYFLYYEETDWCLKARKRGYKLLVDLDSVVVHRVSQSMHRARGIHKYYLIRNRLEFARRWSGGWFWPVAVPSVVVLALLSIAYTTLRGHTEARGHVLNALRDFARGRLSKSVGIAGDAEARGMS
ncbi:MAG TPA: glycosyltransferase family 2 protein [Candidatus Thermoplasmatota archaeon]|nr:glycosyltransferase family 2 protein [Candidatus Thermoplasmatota archaeon]